MKFSIRNSSVNVTNPKFMKKSLMKNFFCAVTPPSTQWSNILIPSTYLKTHYPTWKLDNESIRTRSGTFTSKEVIGHFADHPLEHTKPQTYLILFIFLLKLQFALNPLIQSHNHPREVMTKIYKWNLWLKAINQVAKILEPHAQQNKECF